MVCGDIGLKVLVEDPLTVVDGYPGAFIDHIHDQAIVLGSAGYQHFLPFI